MMSIEVSFIYTFFFPVNVGCVRVCLGLIILFILFFIKNTVILPSVVPRNGINNPQNKFILIPLLIFFNYSFAFKLVTISMLFTLVAKILFTKYETINVPKVAYMYDSIFIFALKS